VRLSLGGFLLIVAIPIAIVALKTGTPKNAPATSENTVAPKDTSAAIAENNPQTQKPAETATSETKPPILVQIGSHITLKRLTVACPTTEDLSRVGSLFRDNDQTAATSYIWKHCRPYLPDGTVVTVENHSFWNGASCVRPQGETDCLWIPDSIAQEAADPNVPVPEVHKVAKPDLPPPVSPGTPVKFKRKVVACPSLEVRLDYFDNGDPQELSSHHCVNIPEGTLTAVRKYSDDGKAYCVTVPGWKDCGWILEEPQAGEIVHAAPTPAANPKSAKPTTKAHKG
jgi:hypothetical protein